MRRLTGIAALLVFMLTMPLARAYAVVSHGAQAQQDCCKHSVLSDQCGEMSSNLCCVVQAPVDTTPYPVQNVSSPVLPSATVAVVYDNRGESTSSSLARYFPAQHSPPGLVIAATIVLRI